MTNSKRSINIVRKVNIFKRENFCRRPMTFKVPFQYRKDSYCVSVTPCLLSPSIHNHFSFSRPSSSTLKADAAASSSSFSLCVCVLCMENSREKSSWELVPFTYILQLLSCVCGSGIVFIRILLGKIVTFVTRLVANNWEWKGSKMLMHFDEYSLFLWFTLFVVCVGFSLTTFAFV